MSGHNSAAAIDPADDTKVLDVREYPPAFAVLALALLQRRRVTARYLGRERVICPHVLGFSGNRAKLLAYQCGGSTTQGVLPADETRRWRSMFVDEVDQPVIAAGDFVSAANFTAEGSFGMDLVELVVATGRPGSTGSLADG